MTTALLLLFGAVAGLFCWIVTERHPEDYAPGRPIEDLRDAVYEFMRVSAATRNLVRFRGVYTPAAAGQMSPAPRFGDCYVIQDASAGTTRFYLQLSTLPRLRAWWSCTMENA
jgi:hypothetical protein